MIIHLVALTITGPISCGPIEGIHEQLQEKFGERLVSVSTMDATHGEEVATMFYKGNDTWTLLIANKSGGACVAASGGIRREGDPS